MCRGVHRGHGPAGAGGAVLGIDSNIFLPRKEPEEAQRLFREAEARTIGVAIKAVQLLAERDGAKKS